MYTKLPNEFVDDVMPTISAISTVVYVAIARRTIGWQKDSDSISLSQLVRATGLTRPSVVKAINELAQRNLIAVTRQQSNQVSGSNVYTIISGSKQDLPPSQFNLLPSENDLPSVVNDVNYPSKNDLPDVVNDVDHQVVNEIDTQKKDTKRKKDSSAKRDSRLDAWQVQMYRELSRLHVPILFRDQVVQTVSDPDLWQLVITTWIGRGYRPNAIGPMLEWYQKGIPTNAKRQHSRQSQLRSDDGRRTSNSVSPEEYIAINSNQSANHE